jgi:hypothetical protein
MNEQKMDAAGNAITGTIQLSAQLPNGKQIQISSYIYDQEAVQSINDRTDILHEVMDRQRMKASIPMLEAEAKKCEQVLADHRDFYQSIEAKQREGKPLVSTEKEALKNMDRTIQHKVDDLLKAQDALADAKKAVA